MKDDRVDSLTYEELKLDPDKILFDHIGTRIEDKKGLERRLEIFSWYVKAYEEKAKRLPIRNELLVLLMKVNPKYFSTFLSVSDRDLIKDLKDAWIGRILTISDVNSYDEVIEYKKTLSSPGDYVSINPDSTFSLNIPKYPALWAVGVGNLLVKDEDFDLLKLAREAGERQIR
jgi:hypothetical protein